VHLASALFFDAGVFAVVGATLLILTALAHQSVRSHRQAPERSAAAGTGPRGGRLMEVIMAIAIGVLGGSGVWLVLRPRSFQVLIGLALLSYAVNLFIFAMGSLFIGREPIVRPAWRPTCRTTPTRCRRRWC
jgi:hypothetical protein